MAEKLKVAFCSSEVVPFSKTGGLADISGALPLALEEQDIEVIIITPKYKNISFPENKTKVGKNIQVYFIEHNDYFNRDGLYGESSGDYGDNLDRFMFYCREALELLRRVNFRPDIIHCNDWQTALIPVYLKSLYKDDDFFKHTKTLFTIHNLGYQGLFAKDQFKKLQLGWEFFTMETMEFFDKVNILKGGLVFADFLSTVSQAYAQEIQTHELGCGLDGVLATRKEELAGIINGIDYREWDPATDKVIAKNYGPGNVEDKYADKIDLQGAAGLEKTQDLPLLGLISRLSDQKGLDILAAAMDEICNLPLQFVLLGVGEDKYHVLFEKIKRAYPENVSINLKFDSALASKIYAGCDLFLMPSRYEPCGLGQMISLKYGTIPIVRKTGGLADTIFDFLPPLSGAAAAGEGNGFVFSEYSSGALLETIKRAISVYAQKNVWKQLVKRVMACDFSWEQSAQKYARLYSKIKKK